jgi:hypothetical protein
LSNLTPKRRFISAKAVEHAIIEIRETQEAPRSKDRFKRTLEGRAEKLPRNEMQGSDWQGR